MSSDFRKDMAWSHGQLSVTELWEILRPRFPNCVGLKGASESEDKRGTDYWLTKRSGGLIGIDAKIRRTDCRKFGGADDLCIELDSGRVIGWAMDRNKACDYIAWVWADTRRTYVAPFSQVLTITALNAERWKKVYGPKMVSNSTYKTEVCFVPLSDFEASLAKWNRGEFI